MIFANYFIIMAAKHNALLIPTMIMEPCANFRPALPCWEDVSSAGIYWINYFFIIIIYHICKW
jgi:hypothetical protein